MCKTDYGGGGGGGGKNGPKIDYVICERPLMIKLLHFAISSSVSLFGPG